MNFNSKISEFFSSVYQKSEVRPKKKNKKRKGPNKAGNCSLNLENSFGRIRKIGNFIRKFWKVRPEN